MRVRKPLVCLTILFATCFVLSGCGGDEGKEWSLVRYVNVVSDEPLLDFLRDEDVLYEDIAFMEYTDYDRTESEGHLFSANVSDGYQQIAFKTTSVADDENYSFIVTGTTYDAEAIMLLNETDKPSGGRSNVRFFNSVRAIGKVDAYVIPAGQRRADLPAAEDIAYRQASNYVSGDLGEYYIRFTTAGTGTVLAESDPINFQDGEVRTIILARGLRHYGIVVLPDRTG